MAANSNDKIQKFLDLEESHDRQKIDKSALRKLLQQMLAEKKLLFSGCFLLIITTVVSVYEPRFLGQLIDQALAKKDKDLLLLFVIGFFFLQLIRVVTLIAHTYLFSKLGQNVMQELRMQLFKKMQVLPLATFNKVPVGKLVTRITNDVSSLADMFTAGFVTIIGNILFAIGTVVWLLVLNFKLGLAAIAILPVLLGFSVYFSKKLKIAYRTARSKLSALNAFFAENILGMKVIQIFNRQIPHVEKFRDLNNQYAQAQFGSVRVFSLFQPSITMATGISMALVIWYGGHMAVNSEITIGFLASYFAYVLSLFQPLREIADKWNVFLAGMASVERIYSILEWDPESAITDIENEVTALEEIKGKIEFKNISFAYEGENWILKNFSLTIEPGMKIGIVGPTGSGKTTLINLLMRFYEPQQGQILIDGKDIREYDKRRLRASIGLIQQEVFLFSGSISENMTLWRRFFPEVRDQLRSIATFNKFEALGMDKEDLLQERGGNISMGERQIMAFARALHTKPKFWIMDEATSNIDSESEKELENLLHKSSHGRTMITIAHRLASVRDADKIIVLQNGQMIESGKHQDLMNHNGLYARIYRCQELS